VVFKPKFTHRRLWQGWRRRRRRGSPISDNHPLLLLLRLPSTPQNAHCQVDGRVLPRSIQTYAILPQISRKSETFVRTSVSILSEKRFKNG
jgi:hypothetical protein